MAAVKHDPRYLTGDRVPALITDGMSVWTNDLDLAWLDFGLTKPEGEFWDGWWTARNHHGGTSLVNSERMAVHHPMTGRKAPAFRTLTRRQWDVKVAAGNAVTSSTVEPAVLAKVQAENPEWVGTYWCRVDDVMVPCNVLT